MMESLLNGNGSGGILKVSIGRILHGFMIGNTTLLYGRIIKHWMMTKMESKMLKNTV